MWKWVRLVAALALFSVAPAFAQTPKYPSDLYTFTKPTGACPGPGCITKDQVSQMAKEVQSIEATLGVNMSNVPSGGGGGSCSSCSTLDHVPTVCDFIGQGKVANGVQPNGDALCVTIPNGGINLAVPNRYLTFVGATLTPGLVDLSSHVTGSLPQGSVSGLAASLAAKADDSLAAHLAGAETFTGAKNFTVVPTLGTLSGVLKGSSGTVSGAATTTDVPEGSRLYYTDGRAQTANAAALALKADDSGVLHKGGSAESVTKVVTFSTLPVVGSLSGILKGTAGALSVATPGVDYGASVGTANEFQRGDGSGGFVATGVKGYSFAITIPATVANTQNVATCTSALGNVNVHIEVSGDTASVASTSKIYDVPVRLPGNGFVASTWYQLAPTAGTSTLAGGGSDFEVDVFTDAATAPNTTTFRARKTVAGSAFPATFNMRLTGRDSAAACAASGSTSSGATVAGPYPFTPTLASGTGTGLIVHQDLATLNNPAFTGYLHSSLYSNYSRFRVFGASDTVGAGSTGGNTSGADYVAAVTGWPLTKFALAFYRTADVAGIFVLPRNDVAVGDISWFSGGGNDMNASATPTSKARHQVETASRASIIWLAIPEARKIHATAGSVTASGGWTTDTAPPWFDHKQSSTPGSTLSYTMNGRTLYVGYSYYNGGGLFTVTVDGVVYGPYDGSDGDTTSYTYGPSGLNGRIPFAIRIPDLSPTQHSVVVTVGAGGAVSIGWFASDEKPGNEAGPAVIVPNVIRLPAATKAAAGDVFSEILWRVARELRSDGLRVITADWRNYYNPDLNNSGDNIHPNDAGYQEVALATLFAVNVGSVGTPRIEAPGEPGELLTAGGQAGLRGSGVKSYSTQTLLSTTIDHGNVFLHCTSDYGTQVLRLAASATACPAPATTNLQNTCAAVPSASVAKAYTVVLQHDNTASWLRLTPDVDTGPSGFPNDDFEIDVKQSTGSGATAGQSFADFRVRRKAGTTTDLTAFVNAIYQSTPVRQSIQVVGNRCEPRSLADDAAVAGDYAHSVGGGGSGGGASFHDYAISGKTTPNLVGDSIDLATCTTALGDAVAELDVAVGASLTESNSKHFIVPLRYHGNGISPNTWYELAPTGGTTNYASSPNNEFAVDVFVASANAAATFRVRKTVGAGAHAMYASLKYAPRDPAGACVISGASSVTGPAVAGYYPFTPSYRVQTPHTWTVQGSIAIPSGDTDFIPPFFVPVPAGATVTLKRARYKINSGTSATMKLQKNGSDVSGYTGLSVTTTAAQTVNDATFVDNDVLALVVTAVSGSPKNLSFTVVLEESVLR